MPAESTIRPTEVVADARPVLDVEAGTLALPVWPETDPESGESGEAGGPGGQNGPGGPAGPAGPRVGTGADEVASALGLDLPLILDRENAKGEPGEIVSVPVYAAGRGAASVDGEVDVTRVLLVGVGDGTAASFRRAGAAVARAAKGVERLGSTVTAGADDARVRAFVEGAVLATYALGGFRGSEAPARTLPLGTLVLAGDEDRSTVVRLASAVAEATWTARDLVHTPSNVKDPAWLAERARQLGSAHGLDVRVRDEKALEAEGFGGILAVGMGSARPPRLIAMRYEPEGAGATTPHVVLVGKGITYDTGGLSLKPREAMVPMKTDMSGGAVVMGVLSAVRELGVDVRVTGLVAAAENMPGASAQRPSDVIRQYDGTTVEVLNTDAEGRLVLADAIGYAVAELEPSVVVDVATLTGAATQGLGRTHAAMYATGDDLAAALTRAGDASGERMWRLPLVDDYRSALESSVADVAHIETTKVGGGSITAALFLQRFVRDVAWAHLDIAGVGRADADRAEVVKGGTAFGVRALLYWLEEGVSVAPGGAGRPR
ncbi:leucyl aminopeptidase [Haloactinopolyspora alba]|uniref:Probable cytosol aminopeptidase n=1 Tax=Haloactinopolyspora alba TaxID=648780 RepID=A0A2P8DXB0_9ACTN|nr:leucyl aminopeptidase [Haloactinopolyspora alba]PSL01859.1 leucyl aminopeptidase [Haloactinopolyspora alba]